MDTTDAYDLVNSILSLYSSSSKPSEDDDIDDEVEQFIRKLTLLLVRLHWAQAATQMDSINQEFELLYLAPEEDKRFGASIPVEEDKTWRLDFVHRPVDPDGPLLDASGKVCTYVTPKFMHVLFPTPTAPSSIYDFTILRPSRPGQNICRGVPP